MAVMYQWSWNGMQLSRASLSIGILDSKRSEKWNSSLNARWCVEVNERHMELTSWPGMAKLRILLWGLKMHWKSLKRGLIAHKGYKWLLLLVSHSSSKPDNNFDWSWTSGSETIFRILTLDINYNKTKLCSIHCAVLATGRGEAHLGVGFNARSPRVPLGVFQRHVSLDGKAVRMKWETKKKTRCRALWNQEKESELHSTFLGTTAQDYASLTSNIQLLQIAKRSNTKVRQPI